MRTNDIYDYDDAPWRGRGAWGGHHGHHDHGHYGHHDPEGRYAEGRGERRADRRRGPWVRDDELGRQVGKLFGAVRAAAHADPATRLATSRLLDETSRDLYRLLADAPDAPSAPTPDGPTTAA